MQFLYLIIGFILLLCSNVETFVSHYFQEFISNNHIEGCRMIQQNLKSLN